MSATPHTTRKPASAMAKPSLVSKRLKSALSPEIQELISTPRLNRELVPGFPFMLRINEAHVLMLAETGLIPIRSASNIARALQRMREEGVEAIVPNPLLEDAYFNIEARLIEIAGQEDGGNIHIGRSRNDLGAAMERMRARDLLLDAIAHGATLLHAFAEQGARHADVVMTGYTHLQPAQPITFGHYVTAIGAGVQRDMERLQQAWDRLNRSPLGAGALAGTPFAIDRYFCAQLLGFDGLCVNTLDAVASRDYAMEILAALTGMATTLSRMATDFYAFSSFEFGLIDFPDSVAGTSSIMPQKKNLAFIEHLRAKPAHIVAGFTSMVTAIKGTHFSNTMDGNREGMRFFWEAVTEGIASIRLGRLAVQNVEPLGDTMLANSRVNYSTVTDLADLLVKQNDLSFRTAHHVVGAVVQHVMKHAKGVPDIGADVVSLALRETAGLELKLSEDEIITSLDPVNSVMSRDLPGGPAGDRVREMADQLADNAAQFDAWIETKRSGVMDAQADLEKRVAALAARQAPI